VDVDGPDLVLMAFESALHFQRHQVPNGDGLLAGGEEEAASWVDEDVFDAAGQLRAGEVGDQLLILEVPHAYILGG
jgi:hypothetical protein